MDKSNIRSMCQPGKISFILGGQFGSEGKGAAAAYVAAELAEDGLTFDIITTNAGAQAGHTSIYNGLTRVTNFLPTAALIAMDNGLSPLIYLNAGAILHPEKLLDEISDFVPEKYRKNIIIHPNAAIITEDCVAAELDESSSQTHISSTRKGVGQALARKVLRSGPIARDCPALAMHLQVSEFDINAGLAMGLSALAEVPQGLSLSLDSGFYPYCTSRNCTIEGALADAGVHPVFAGPALLVLRTFPIRVGSLDGKSSGGHFIDQDETSWDRLGVPVELTTVTKRPRRVFTFSLTQALLALARVRPEFVLLTFCDYLAHPEAAAGMAARLRDGAPHTVRPEFLAAFGPATTDIKPLTL